MIVKELVGSTKGKHKLIERISCTTTSKRVTKHVNIIDTTTNKTSDFSTNLCLSVTFIETYFLYQYRTSVNEELCE